MSSDSPIDETAAINDIDRDAARRALERNWPQVESSSTRYGILFEGLAQFHHRFGAESFELRYHLRPPKDRTELWQQQCNAGELTEAELASRLKADAERPIDLEMLTAFYDAFQEKLPHYAGVLQRSVIKPSEASSSVVRESEKAIDEHIAALNRSIRLWKENIRTTLEYLEELRITSGQGLVKLKDFEATSAHWLALLLFRRMSEAWQSCRQISDRSRTDPRSLYEVDAITLFGEHWLPKFPSPQSVKERLREEFILARASLRRKSEEVAGDKKIVQEPTDIVINEEWQIDNESRELVLIGEFSALVGKAGHIFRPTPNSDWGIDGEIEFKNNLGHASGKRLYIQLKSGDSYLKVRISDGVEVFTAKNTRHLSYWRQQAYPVMLVIRQSSGLIRWMDVSAALKSGDHESAVIIFRGEQVTPASIRQIAENRLAQN